MRRATVAILFAAGAALASGGHHAPPAVAAAEATAAAEDDVHRAVVVVDLGNGEVRSACVRFRQQSITGIDLLRTARMDPVVQTYAGQGGAVCKLCGVGCSAGSDCLTCQAPKYWQYWRSDGGTGTYTYSQRGAGDTAVTDGDVEGWSWSGSEDPPPFLTVAEACSGPNVYDHQPSSAATSTSTTTTSSSASTSPSLSPTTTAGTSLTRPPAGVPTTSPVVASPAASTAASSITTALAPSTSTTTGETGELASRDASSGDPGGSGSNVPGLVAFAVVLAAILGTTARLRRARRSAGGPDGGQNTSA